MFLLQREREKELSDLHREYALSDRQSKQKFAEQQEKLVLLGKLQLEEEQHKKRIAERDGLLRNLAEKYHWSVRHSLIGNINQSLGEILLKNSSSTVDHYFVHLIEPSQINDLKKSLVETLERLQSEESETKSKIEIEVRTAQAEIYRLREECVRLEQDIKSKDNVLNVKMR